MERINVTKTFLPPLEEYEEYLKEIWDRNYVTNQGPLLKKFEKQLSEYLGVDYLHFVGNGTLALQLALSTLDQKDGEIITTPFSYVATISSILWERFKPVFVDIDIKTLCIDENLIEEKINKNTRAILGVHVFGNPCNVEKIQEIAKNHNLKVIYDGAHAFGVTYKDKSLLSYGDVSTCSFHATKVFHTIEGGCLIVKDNKMSEKMELRKRFGHDMDEHSMLGINAKATEFQAAMGLLNLKYLESNQAERRALTDCYNSLLPADIKAFELRDGADYNYSYYPVIFETEDVLIETMDRLIQELIFPRRYFYPSLNTMPYVDYQSCPISEDISKRIICLPLYVGLGKEVIEKIAKICRPVSI